MIERPGRDDEARCVGAPLLVWVRGRTEMGRVEPRQFEPGRWWVEVPRDGLNTDVDTADEAIRLGREAIARAYEPEPTPAPVPHFAIVPGFWRVEGYDGLTEATRGGHVRVKAHTGEGLVVWGLSFWGETATWAYRTYGMALDEFLARYPASLWFPEVDATPATTPPDEPEPTRTLFSCRTCCAQSCGGWSDGAMDRPGWHDIERIDGPRSMCPGCWVIGDAMLDGLREEYPHASIGRERPHRPTPATAEPARPSGDPILMAARAEAIASIVLRLGRTNRITLHPDATMPESVTDHTVMLAIVAAELAPPRLDRGNVLAFAVVHDLVEAYAGDTPTLVALGPEARAAKDAREAAALDRIRGEVHPDSWVVRMIEAYERQDTIEARWVHALDKCCPKLVHVLDGGASVRAQGVGLDHVRERVAGQLAAIGDDLPEARLLGEALLRDVEAAWITPATEAPTATSEPDEGAVSPAGPGEAVRPRLTEARDARDEARALLDRIAEALGVPCDWRDLADDVLEATAADWREQAKRHEDAATVARGEVAVLREALARLTGQAESAEDVARVLRCEPGDVAGAALAALEQAALARGEAAGLERALRVLAEVRRG